MTRGAVAVILNPAAGRGRAARLGPALRAAFGRFGVPDVRETTAAAQEYDLARRAIEDGVATLVAVGGDGTWSNVANAILASGADCRLALLAAGTGNDFAWSAGVPSGDVARTALLACDGPDDRVDVGKLGDRYFLNAAGFGFDVAVLKTAQRPRRWHGKAVYVWSAIREAIRYRGFRADVDGVFDAVAPRHHLMLIAANGRRFGGAFRIAPTASLRDGLLDIVRVADVSPHRRPGLLASALRGAHLGRKEVCHARLASVSLRFDDPPACEMDGELSQLRGTTVEICCQPGALRIVGARPVDGTPSGE